MEIRPISEKLQKIATVELNENPRRIQEDLENLREWLKKQPHLHVRSDDQSLIIFLRGCKWSLQRTKEKIDCFYTVRSYYSSFFMNRDPLDPFIQSILNCGAMYPLPNVNELDGSRILFVDMSAVNYELMDVNAVIKLFFIIIDALMIEDDNFMICGKTLVVNYENIPLSFYLQITPPILKRFAVCWQSAYPIRIKKLIGINAISAVEKLYSILKAFLSKKLQSRFHLFSAEKREEAYKHLPKKLFPQKLGGENGTTSEAIEKCKCMVESHREWFLDDSKYITNEKLRPGKAKIDHEALDVEGSFRQLEID